MHKLNKIFDKVVCINLAERFDKKEKIQHKFDKLGIKVEWFTAVQYGFIPNIVNPIINSKTGHFNKNQPYELGCALSHYSVIKQALLEKCTNLFVFEDDVMFHKDFNNKLDIYLNELNNNWDMIMFYSFMYNLLPQNIRISKRWMKAYKAWSLMAYGMNEKIMSEYIKRQDKFFTISDAVTYNLQEENNYNIYSAVPALCIPETKLGSNIRGDNLNYKYSPTITNMGYGEEHYE